MKTLKELQILTKHFTLLYVEDNPVLRKNVVKLLKKFFFHVGIAEDGSKALALFKKQHFSIVITDIKMPKMDGFELIRHIKSIKPNTKTIIISEYDNKEYLLEGIKLGVFRFLKKPLNASELTTTLYELMLKIRDEEHEALFQRHLQNIFKYQSSMLALLRKGSVILANDIFLDFFGFESKEECTENLEHLGDKFLPQEGFLYNHNDTNALEHVKNNPDKLYNIKMKNRDDEVCHFIIKYQTIPEKDDYGILSFDDITELNLLELFDDKHTLKATVTTNPTALYEFLNIIYRNSAKVELHNYYKGLSITNNASIHSINDNLVELKTTYMQQKAVQIERKTLIVSDALPHVIEASEVEKISFEMQTISFKKLKFIATSPIARKTIRVVPDEKHRVTLFIDGGKYQGDTEIEDISLDAIKVKVGMLPPGLNEESEIILDIVLELDKKPLIINTKGILYRTQESKHSFSLVFMFKDLKKSDLVPYITKRQMELIREIKGMQNE